MSPDHGAQLAALNAKVDQMGESVKRIETAVIGAGKFTEAAGAMQQSAWHKQTGRRAVKLCAMMRSGKIPSNEVKA